jgi:hypothetical protein
MGKSTKAPRADFEEVRQLLGLGRAQERLGHREPAGVELPAQIGPCEPVDAAAQRRGGRAVS